MGNQLCSYLLLVEGACFLLICCNSAKTVSYHAQRSDNSQVLQVKSDGSLISDLDLFHHRPYECLLIGYCHGEVSLSSGSLWL